jgi:hypothetical protein
MAASPRVPHLRGAAPNTSLPHAGLPLLTAIHANVFIPDPIGCVPPRRPGACLGTYNHAPMITRVNGTLLAAWHNGARLEDSAGSRVLYSTSSEASLQWSTPTRVLFEPLSDPIPDPNELGALEAVSGTVVYSKGFHRFGIRQYAFAAAYNVRCSAQCRASGAAGSVQRRCCERCLGCCSCFGIKERLPELMRSVRLEGDKGESLGPMFWLASNLTLHRSYNLTARERDVPSYESMPLTVRLDAHNFMHQQLSEHAPPPPPPATGSERSAVVQAIPNQRPDELPLMMLIRDDGNPSSLVEWATICQIDGLDPTSIDDLTFATARGQQLVLPLHVSPKCNWTVPVPTNIPDSRSSTCMGVLPNGTRYLLGSQLPRLWDRDPLTVTTSSDGVAFDSIDAVRANAPPPKFPDFTKGPGYQYPQAVVTESGDALIVVYSVNKEQIASSRISLG